MPLIAGSGSTASIPRTFRTLKLQSVQTRFALVSECLDSRLCPNTGKREAADELVDRRASSATRSNNQRPEPAVGLGLFRPRNRCTRIGNTTIPRPPTPAYMGAYARALVRVAIDEIDRQGFPVIVIRDQHSARA